MKIKSRGNEDIFEYDELEKEKILYKKVNDFFILDWVNKEKVDRRFRIYKNFIENLKNEIFELNNNKKIW